MKRYLRGVNDTVSRNFTTSARRHVAAEWNRYRGIINEKYVGHCHSDGIEYVRSILLRNPRCIALGFNFSILVRDKWSSRTLPRSQKIFPIGMYIGLPVDLREG